MSVEEARRKARWGVRGRDQAGTHWTVWLVPPATPPSYGELATRRRQGQLRAYREATGQEPWDVPGSWPAPSIGAAASRAGSEAESLVRRLPPGPVPQYGWTARPRWR